MNYTKHPDYDKLPQVIKDLYSPKEYAFLPETLKKSIIDNECLPDDIDEWEPSE